jgi:hypothetical protein
MENRMEMSPVSLEHFQKNFVGKVADKLIRNELSPKHKKRIERRLQKEEVGTDKFVFEFTRRQTSILLTAMVLVKVEILSKAFYTQSKPTLEIMEELNKLLQLE